MEFENRLKGYVAETIIECLLCDAGYKALRAGIEKRVLEPAVLQGKDGRIEVPDVIRTMPDFLVLGGEQPRLTEIKYRCDWQKHREELAGKVATQVAFVPGLLVVVCSGKPQVTSPKARRGPFEVWPSRHLAVVRPFLKDGVPFHESTDGIFPLSNCGWGELEHIQDAFPLLKERKHERTLLKAAHLIAEIEGSIDRVTGVANEMASGSVAQTA